MEANIEHEKEIVLQRQIRVLLMEIAQGFTVALADFFTAAAWTRMVTAITVLIEEGNGGQGRAFIGQLKGIQVVPDDPFRAMFRLVKGVSAVCFPVAVTE